MNKQLELKEFNEYLKGKVAEGTRELYMEAMTKWFGVINGKEPDQDMAQAYVDKLKEKLAPSTVAIRGHAIMRWFRWHKVAVKLDLPSIGTPTPRYYNVLEIGKLLEACRSLLETTLITVLFDCGLRISELLGLKLVDIHRDTLTLTVTGKGNRIGQVNITKKAMDVLDTWIEKRGIESDKVFGALNYQEARKMMIGIGTRAGFSTPRLHMLRHSRAVQMLNAKTPPYVVQQHLRHRTIATTLDVYGQFTAVDLKEHIPEW